MVSLRQTSLKYRGRKAETYDEVRVKQARWHFENEVVTRWLRDLKPSSVLDCPVGTGRFIDVYADMNVPMLQGIDISEEMVALASKKVPRIMRQHADVDLRVGDASKLDLPDASHDVAVCVRFLDLIDEEAMLAVLTEMCRVSKSAILLTIRLGKRYVPKSNTAEHDEKKFWALVRRLGWECGEKVPFRDAGWWIIRLQRRK